MLDNKRKIIIDTDIGDDVDDMFAVLMGLTADVEVIGLTTVFRNSVQRAKLTKYILKKTKLRDVPVYAGVDKPLIQVEEDLTPDTMTKVEERDGVYTLPQYIPEMDGERFDECKDAVDFLIESAEKYGEQLTICSIGPTTNIALAIMKSPKTMKRVKEIRVLGGAFTYQFKEWNVYADPEAMRIVLTSGIDVKMMGLDVTMKCPFTDDMMCRLKGLNNEGAKLVKTMIDRWLDHFTFTQAVMHDPLLIATVLRDDIVTFKEKYVLVELQGERRAETIIEDSKNKYNSKVWVGLEVDNNKFYKIFESTVFTMLENLQ